MELDATRYQAQLRRITRIIEELIQNPAIDLARRGPLTLDSLSGSIPEDVITDGVILARVAAAETISGIWTFTGRPVFEQTASTNDAWHTFVTGESVARLAMRADGRMFWGPGSGGGDVDLFRAGVDILQTSDQFKAAGGLTTKTKAGTPTDADMTLDEDGNFLVNTTNHRWAFRSGGSWREIDAIPQTANSAAGGDTTLVINTRTNIVSVSLGAGTWWLGGHLTFDGGPNRPCEVDIRIHDGTSTFSGGTASIGTPEYITLHLSAIVTPSSTTTYHLEGISNVSSSVVKASTPTHGTGQASKLWAIRVGN